MNRKIMLGAIACGVFTLFSVLPASSFAQDDKSSFDPSKVPATAGNIAGFVPKGWKLEEDVTGDLNGDGIADHVLKLIEEKPANAKEDEMNVGNRAMVIVFADKEGKLRRAAVAPSVLQCAGCGGAFYGVSSAPANVSIKKGVIIVEQDYGSRWVSDMTFRFRFDEQPNMFILIGFDYSSRDRAAGGGASESTNYLTGTRITTTTTKSNKTTTKTTKVAKDRIGIEAVEKDKFDEEANKRLGLD
jgi:hypothetical protein